MSETFSKVEVITGVARRRRFSTELKLAVVAETMQPGMSVSYVARRHGLSPSLVFRWRQLMNEGGKEAVRADDQVVAASELRRLEERVRELEFQRPQPEAELSEQDANSRGIRNGEEVTIRSNGTSVRLRARLSRELRPGVVRVPEEFAGDLQPTVEISK